MGAKGRPNSFQDNIPEILKELRLRDEFDILSTREVGDYLGISERAARAQMERHCPDAKRVGHQRVIVVAAFKRWLQWLYDDVG